MKKSIKPRYKVHIAIEPEYKEFLLNMAAGEDLPLATYLRRLIKKELKNNWKDYEESK